MPDKDDVDIEPLPNGTFIWVYQSPAGAFYRAPTDYSNKAAARRAGRDWLKNRRDPRRRGR